MAYLPVILAYFIGAIPFGLLLGKVAGVDVRQHGSGNIGATNVFRVCGWKWGVTAFAFDFLKGFAPVFWLPALFAPEGSRELICALTTFFAVAGHTWPVYLRFKGGKGVATSAGALMALMPAAMGIALLTFAIVFGLSRYVSLGSTAGTVALLTSYHLMTPAAWSLERPITILVWLMAVLVIIRHRSNYVRLWKGTENRMGGKPKNADNGSSNSTPDATEDNNEKPANTREESGQ